jgi:hypothetical protein
MNQNDEIEFASLMAGMSEVFGVENTKTKVDIYFEQLREFSIDEVKRAVGLSLKTLKFFPKIAELRELIQGGPARSSDSCPYCKERMADCFDHWFCVNCQVKFPKLKQIANRDIPLLEDLENE